MSSINETFTNAILADATYVHDIDPRVIDASLESKLSDRMTPTLAKYISDNFSVVTQIQSGDILGSGFDATVWRNTSSGKLYVAMRGTEPGTDLIDADIDLGVWAAEGFEPPPPLGEGWGGGMVPKRSGFSPDWPRRA